MCGIAGILSLAGETISRDRIESMTGVLRHRGPDDGGVYLDGALALGHRRLSILDLSPNGHQPMSNEDGSVWVTFNGEIYNCGDLREELAGKGHQFRSRTDTEVLVHLYEERGSEMVHALNGMFAFAIWDGRRRRLFLARDRLGIKPLFYADTGGFFVFGSEIKAVLAAGVLGREADLVSLHHYLSLNYLAAPRTLFKGIHQLRPGEWMTAGDGPRRSRVYWELPRETRWMGEAEAVREFDARLEKAVRGQMLSDVPVGAFLSGGLDSSTLAYYMKKALPGVRTFSIGFREEAYDEAPYARRVAEHLGTAHFEETVTADARSILEALVEHAEEPTADASMIPVWYLSKMTRAHVTVALSGDGADELLAGYETYQANILANAYRRMPMWARRLIVEPLVRSLPARDGKIPLDYKLKRFIAAANLPAERAHFSWRIIFDEAQKRSLLKEEFREAGAGADPFEACEEFYAGRTGLNRFLAMDAGFYLPSDMLTKVDRMSMAHSLEVRVPFLDHELAEFLARLPEHFKLRRFFTKKYLMKQLMRDRLPREIVHRRKAGFNVPLNRWFKGELREYMRDALSPEAVARLGFFEPARVSRLLEEHERGTADWSYQIYGLLIFALWHRRFLAGPSEPRRDS